MTIRLRVDGAQPYDVVVGRGLAGEVAGPLAGAERVVVVADEAVAELAGAVGAGLSTSVGQATVELIDGGEQAKTYEGAAQLWETFAAAGVTRSDAVVSVGGGATSDLVGYAAACWLRGVTVVHVPTTLLGMVDAAVGGKTGINTPAGKNLVGAFHPPAGVVVDLDVLEKLPPAQWVNGMAEVVKAGFIADPVILDLVEAGGGSGPTSRDVEELVVRSIQVKADVVGRDLTETGPRESLNYGHTLGHALERRSGYRMPHGHGVSVGMVFAAELARLAGRLDDGTATRHREVLSRVGLPVTYPEPAAWEELHTAMASDKKARGATLRFVVLDGLARPAILAGPSEDLLRGAFAAVAA